jgi:2-furoyl-CoA dehydrogenase FAD binding subunit
MKPAPFSYCRPATVAEAVDVLNRHGTDAQVLAGGQSLLPLLNARRLRAGLLVDINRVEGLGDVVVGEGRVTIGANVRQAHGFDRSVVPLLADAIPHVGHVQTRNRGTVCGSLAHADPLAELPLAMLVTGGEVELAGPAGTRLVDIDDFFVGAFAPSVEPGDLVVASRWRVPGEGATSAFTALASGTNLSAAAALVEPQDNGGMRVRCGVNGTVDRARAVELLVASGDDPAAVIDELVAAAIEDADFITDGAADGEYRRALAAELAIRALTEALP